MFISWTIKCLIPYNATSFSKQNHTPLSTHNIEHYRMRLSGFHGVFYKSSLPGCDATSMGVPRPFERTEDRNILYKMKRRKTTSIGHILRRNFLLKHVIEGRTEGRIEVTERRGRRRDQLLDDLKEKRGYWRLN